MKRKTLPILLAVCGLLGQAVEAGAAGRADAVNLGSLGTDSQGYGYSTTVAVNDAGQVAGSSFYYVNGADQGHRAFLWSNGTMTNLGSLGTNVGGNGESKAVAINNAGQVAGDSRYFVNGVSQGYRAFLWSNGAMTNLGSLGTDANGGGDSRAAAMNNAGQVAGYSDYYVNGVNQGRRAFLWSNGTMINLGSLGTNSSGGGYSAATAINNAGQVAGSSVYYVNGAAQWYRALVVSNGVMTNLGDLNTSVHGIGSWAVAINNAGQVAGGSDYYVNGVSQGQRAFLWSNGAMTNLGSLGGASTATALNDTGQVVGYSITGADDHAFLYNAGTMYDLNERAPAGWTFTAATAINAYGQVAVNAAKGTQSGAFLFTPHPDWQGGNGNWADASRWNYGGMGAFGFTPGAPHDVVINPTGSATVYGPVDASVHSLTVAGQGSNLVTLNLNGGSIATSNGTTLGANGTLAGGGRLQGNLFLQVGGRVYVRDNQSLQLAGNVANAGRVDVLAIAGRGSLEVGGKLINAAGGSVNLMNADVVIHGGIVNGDRVSIAGLTSIAGTVDNVHGGEINVSGSGHAYFWDDLRNNGSVTVTTGSTATFFGLVNGAGSFVGGGAKEFAGGYSPGNSPALTTMDGPVTFSSAITMELAGTAFGSEHDKTIFNGAVTLSGADLDVVWYDGYQGKDGDYFDLFDWNGGLTGTFGQIDLPTLALGLSWDTSNLYTDGSISVIGSAPPVPEPETYAMLLAGLGIMGAVVRRRKAA